MGLVLRFIHTSDLHLGKILYNFSMIEDQKYILEQIIEIIRKNDADALIVSGDIYDRSVPVVDAVCLFDDFITKLHGIGCPVYIVSGNHDSSERVSFANELLAKQGVFISDTFSGKMQMISVNDDNGMLNIYLLPFIKTSTVRAFYPDESIETLNDAIRVVIKNSDVREDERNLLVAHQFFISKDEELLLGGSETCVPTVGGIDSVSSDVLMPFDYVALGHIHRPQKVGRETVRYSGSPLKYSESEYLNSKGVVMVDIRGKDDVSIELIPLEPMRDLRVIEGTVEQLREASKDGSLNNDDYVYVKLTEDAVDAKASLNTAYPNILAIDLLRLSSSDQDLPQIDIVSLRSLDPSEIFGDLFKTVNGKDMTDKQKSIFDEAFEKAREGLE